MTQPPNPTPENPPRPGQAPAPPDWQGDPLSRFPAEAELVVAARARKAWLLWMVGLLALVLVLAAAGAAFGPRLLARFRADRPAILTIESAPPGIRVLEDGRALGMTPLTVSLTPGPRTLTLERGGATRPLVLDLQPGAHVVHHVELSEAPRDGTLHVETTPPGAQVEVDGVAKGVTPVDVTGLAPGEHVVLLKGEATTVTERVTVSSGATASLLVPLSRAAAGTAGWVSVSSPIELQMFEGDAFLGSSRISRVMLPTGPHTLRLVNTETGFETTTNVMVTAGATGRVNVRIPNGQLSVNAVPWAEVFLDGRRIGETPIANFATPLGPHEIILRHPRYGEQRRNIVVSLSAPVRLGVDLRQ